MYLSFAKYILPKSPGIVSLLGAGGKTSLMFLLAREIQAQGKTVLTTTTTKIFYPESEQSALTVYTDQPIQWLTKKSQENKLPKHLTLALAPVSRNKLQGFMPETIDEIWQAGFFDWILVEADGAAGRPIKAPAEYEPVIPKQTNCSVAVLGLQGFKCPLNVNYVFRIEKFTLLTGRNKEETILLDDLMQLLTHNQGIFKGTPPIAEKVLYLNQADNLELVALGKKFAKKIFKENPHFLTRSAVGSTRLKKLLDYIMT